MTVTSERTVAKTTLAGADPVSSAGHGFRQENASRTEDLLNRAINASGAQRQRLWDEVVILNMPLADSLARRYHDRGEDTDDLVQVARMALVRAVQRFDPERGNFVSYAVPTITGELKRHFRDHAWTIRPPRRIQELQSDISTAWAELAQSRGSLPTVNELADHLDQDAEDVSAALAAHGCFHTASLDAPASGYLPDAHERLGEEDPQLEQAELIASLSPACAQLDEEDQRLLYLRFFEQRTQVEIAAELGTNQMAVSRRLSRVMVQLRERLDGAGAENTRRRRRGEHRPHAA